MPVVIGVDSSTQSTKVEVRDSDSGELISSGRATHPSTGVAPVSQAHPSDWVDAFDQAYAQAGSPDAAAISVAGQQHGLVTLDAQNKIVRAAKLWNDTESAADAQWCVDQRDAAWWASHVGSVPVASFTVAKLSWLKRVEPKIGRKLRESVCHTIFYLGTCAVVARAKSQLIAVMHRVLVIGQPRPNSTIMKFCG